MTCPRCKADLQPANFASPRNCAFDERDQFVSDNWQCATMALIRDKFDRWNPDYHHEDDESCAVLAVGEGRLSGWLTLNWYKQRGRTTGAVFLDTETGSATFTLQLAELAITTGRSVRR